MLTGKVGKYCVSDNSDMLLSGSPTIKQQHSSHFSKIPLKRGCNAQYAKIIEESSRSS